MFGCLLLWIGAFLRVFRSRQNLLVENLALRQQVAVFKRQRRRPRLTPADKLFWVLLHRFWSSWKTALIVVSPDTVVRWHRAGFHMYWRLISRVRKRVGRRPVSKEIRELIFKMMAENPTWRAPRIHGELVMLGFEISERSVSRWMRRAPRTTDPSQRWLTFLRNHREAIAAIDFFTVPTVSFSVLYVFFIIGHDRRRILHFNMTRHPTSAWIVQQLREAFPYEPATKFLILDHDAKYGAEVPTAIRSMDIKPVQTAIGCPWQNGIAERWVGNCRRELLDHVIAINQSHLKRLLASYVDYYHQDRTHCGLEKQTPEKRTRCTARGMVMAWPRVGGLHHRYERAASESLSDSQVITSSGTAWVAHVVRLVSLSDWRLSRFLTDAISESTEPSLAGVANGSTRTRFWPTTGAVSRFQGMIAEYEHAQIAERRRRGKRHKAQQGVVNVLSGAPYGYAMSIRATSRRLITKWWKQKLR